MQWTDVINDPCLRDLPYKIELNRWGNIEMSPASNRHGAYQSRMSALLSKHMPIGEVIMECSVQTPEGVKVPDVAWCSTGFLQRHGFETPYSEAPELCVEILSPSNSPWEMLEKVQICALRGGNCPDWIVPSGMQCKAQIAPRGHSHASNLQHSSAPAGGNPTGQFPPRKAYLAAGAVEAWLVSEEGKIAFYDRTGQIAQSSFNVAAEDLVAGLRL